MTTQSLQSIQSSRSSTPPLIIQNSPSPNQEDDARIDSLKDAIFSPQIQHLKEQKSALLKKKFVIVSHRDFYISVTVKGICLAFAVTALLLPSKCQEDGNDDYITKVCAVAPLVLCFLHECYDNWIKTLKEQQDEYIKLISKFADEDYEEALEQLNAIQNQSAQVDHHSIDQQTAVSILPNGDETISQCTKKYQSLHKNCQSTETLLKMMSVLIEHLPKDHELRQELEACAQEQPKDKSTTMPYLTVSPNTTWQTEAKGRDESQSGPTMLTYGNRLNKVAGDLKNRLGIQLETTDVDKLVGAWNQLSLSDKKTKVKNTN